MASLGATLAAIDAIITTIERFIAFGDLFANNAGATVTLEAFQQMVRAENAVFFTVISEATLQAIRNTFYNATLPTIANSSTITQAQLAPGGLHYTLFQNLVSNIQSLVFMKNQLFGVFRAYVNDLATDDLVHGQFLMVRILTLLVHMHSTYATLRRVQQGAASLDDPMLIGDTYLLLSYLDAVEDENLGLRWLHWGTARKRDAEVSEVQRGTRFPFVPYWYWTDSYRVKQNTLPQHSLFIREYAESDIQATIIAGRANHMQQIAVRYDAVTEIVNPFRGRLTGLRNILQARLQSQLAGGGLRILPGPRRLPVGPTDRPAIKPPVRPDGPPGAPAGQTDGVEQAVEVQDTNNTKAVEVILEEYKVEVYVQAPVDLDGEVGVKELRSLGLRDLDLNVPADPEEYRAKFGVLGNPQ